MPVTPTTFSSFAAGNGDGGARGPPLWVLCAAPVTAACEKRQTVQCAHSWRMLLPLWRADPNYLALRNSHDRYERVHYHRRVRWRSSADDHSLRPKRRGRDCQQLRASAALLIQWLMICWREQWLPTSRPKGSPDPARVVADDGRAAVITLTNARARPLDKPYGRGAVKLGLGGESPKRPSEMAQPANPTEPPDNPAPDLTEEGAGAARPRRR